MSIYCETHKRGELQTPVSAKPERLRDLAKNCQQPAEKHTSYGHVRSQRAVLTNGKPQVAEKFSGSEGRESAVQSFEEKLSWNLARDGQKIV
jgi:hypothetical protein